MSNHDDDKSNEIVEMRRQIADLRTMIGNVAQATAIENVISNGFHELTAQLQPLQDLTPKREPLPQQSRELLWQVLLTLERPIWRGTKFEVVTDDDCGQSRRLAP